MHSFIESVTTIYPGTDDSQVNPILFDKHQETNPAAPFSLLMGN
jgi:hypothetical protein